jgi:translation initiation factor IF-1
MGVFNVELQTPEPKLNKKVVVATVSGNMRRHFINLSFGNEVTILIDVRYGMDKGRIVFRNKQ